eukprot:TRINITY_DN2545_c0_g1_i4.p1 TRINITY_DN2545_c0_g1~~TRINITY_DN2545_c0_g1_i4.p1  ORF type:complete len:436 (-),score=176.32 TRINITY_DN2545_c0_g1_i4:473-1780(-)
MSSSSSTTFDPTEFDLTSTIGEFLDRHMMFPLLAFLETTEMYPAEELQAAKVSLLKDTAMLGLYSQSYEQLHGSLEGAEDVEARLTDLKTQLNNLKATAKPLLKIIDDQELMIQFENQKTFNAEYLEENYDITETEINAMYHLAKLQYDAGKYQKAAPLLHNFTHLGKDTELIFNALWGKFACEIMTQNWDAAKNDLSALRDAIESKNWETPLEQLQQRTWLIHWSLFVFFNHPTGRNGIIEMFMDDKYMNAIQTQAPHALRYLAAAVITNKRGRGVLNDLVKVIQVESYTYKDPITEFVQSLYVDFDFDGAQTQLDICLEVLSNDFFLTSIRDEFLHNARLFIFETYCRIHKTIDIAMLAEKLSMDQQAAEKWIVGLIKNAHFGSQHQPKIDSKENHVVMSTQYPSVHQDVKMKTKELMMRTNILTNNLNAKQQ